MNTQHLKAIVLAHKLGSISAAARALGKHQSQVSQWVADIEIDFGVKVFERTGNSTRLSSAGKTLLPMMIHTLSQAEKLQACSIAMARDEPVTLRFGIDNYVPQSCLHRALLNILDDQGINIEVSTDDRGYLLMQLGKGSLDAMLVSEHATLHYCDYDYCRLGSYRDILVVGARHPLTSLQLVSLDHLSCHRELIWTREENCEDSDVGYSPTYATFSELSTLLSLLIQGVGYAFLPEAMLQQQLVDQQLRVLETDFEQTRIERRVELLWQRGLVHTKQGRCFIGAIKQYHDFI